MNRIHDRALLGCATFGAIQTHGASAHTTLSVPQQETRHGELCNTFFDFCSRVSVCVCIIHCSVFARTKYRKSKGALGSVSLALARLINESKRERSAPHPDDPLAIPFIQSSPETAACSRWL